MLRCPDAVRSLKSTVHSGRPHIFSSESERGSGRPEVNSVSNNGMELSIGLHERNICIPISFTATENVDSLRQLIQPPPLLLCWGHVAISFALLSAEETIWCKSVSWAKVNSQAEQGNKAVGVCKPVSGETNPSLLSDTLGLTDAMWEYCASPRSRSKTDRKAERALFDLCTQTHRQDSVWHRTPHFQKKLVFWSDLCLFHRAVVADCSHVRLIHQCQHSVTQARTHAEKHIQTHERAHTHTHTHTRGRLRFYFHSQGGQRSQDDQRVHFARCVVNLWQIKYSPLNKLY